MVNVAADALSTRKIPESAVKAQLTISEYGERMGLSVFLPEEYDFDPGDGHPMALRLECVNSVEGSTVSGLLWVGSASFAATALSSE